MKEIRKYPLRVTDRQDLEMPFGTKALTVQLQYNAPYLWAMVDTDEKQLFVVYPVWMVGTGKPADEVERSCRYISTLQLKEDTGSIVTHVFIGGGA
jgi:hypothetical protein